MIIIYQLSPPINYYYFNSIEEQQLIIISSLFDHLPESMFLEQLSLIIKVSCTHTHTSKKAFNTLSLNHAKTQHETKINLVFKKVTII